MIEVIVLHKRSKQTCLSVLNKDVVLTPKPLKILSPDFEWTSIIKIKLTLHQVPCSLKRKQKLNLSLKICILFAWLLSWLSFLKHSIECTRVTLMYSQCMQFVFRLELARSFSDWTVTETQTNGQGMLLFSFFSCYWLPLCLLSHKKVGN